MSESTERLGDGTVAIRFERSLRHPRERVWRALTETAQLRQWFVDVLDYDRSTLVFAPSAALVFVAGGEVVGRGVVTGYEPPRLLEFTWDEEVLRWELAELDTGCRLVFTNIVDSPETAAAVTEGWALSLERIEATMGPVDARG